MKYKLLLTLILITYSTLSNSEIVIGINERGYFYPINQYWRIQDVIFKNREDTPRDLQGIPVILRGQSVLFTRYYYTFPNINAGAKKIIPYCLKSKTNEAINLIPYDAIGRPGKQIVIEPNGDYLNMPLDKYFILKLKKQSLPSDFKNMKRRLDIAFETIEENMRLKPACMVGVLHKIKLKSKDMVMVKKESGEQTTLKNSILDPDAYIQGVSSSGAIYRIDVSTKNIVIDKCMIKQLWRQRVTSYKKRGSLYILSKYAGVFKSKKELCVRNIGMIKIDTKPVLDFYGIKQTTYKDLIMPPPSSMTFEKWTGDNSFVAYYHDMLGKRNYRFEFFNIDSNKIYVKKL